jgi:hypothetical protein
VIILKVLQKQHLQIAHNVELRNSFFRLNDEVEFDAAMQIFLISLAWCTGTLLCAIEEISQVCRAELLATR